MLGLFLLLFSIIVLIYSKNIKTKAYKSKVEHCIQPGKILYSDLNKPAKPLFSREYLITGKPDYIIKEKNRYIPVELKYGKHEFYVSIPQLEGSLNGTVIRWTKAEQSLTLRSNKQRVHYDLLFRSRNNQSNLIFMNLMKRRIVDILLL